ncbi:olfactory receptor 8D1-like [Rhinophrynus dorsalis]
MTEKNQSKASEFILQSISDRPELQIPLFCLFLHIYLLTLLGNLLIVTMICLNPPLHNPMYFFLSNLSVIDLSYSSVTQPKLLSMLLIGNKTISFNSCMTQLYSFLFFTGAEFFLLSAMAYDRYVAICHPLRYPLLMNTRICILLATTSWGVGSLIPLSHTVFISQLPFCRSHLINHFYCDVSVLLKLSCVDTFFIEMKTYIIGSLVDLPAFVLIIISYVYIISSIMHIHSVKARSKTFSTCASHLTVVILFYGSVLITYMRPSSQYSSSQFKKISILYSALIPLVNPFIYTLRNKDIRKYLPCQKTIKMN